MQGKVSPLFRVLNSLQLICGYAATFERLAALRGALEIE